MNVGDLVRSIHDHTYLGVVVELGSIKDGICAVRWVDVELTYEYNKVLEVVNE